MAQRRMDVDLRPKVQDVLRNADKYHESYYAVNTFRGPSLHFHRRALGLEGEVSGRLQFELIYAVLTSWGMHRMGARGAKMQPFDTFERSVSLLSGDLAALCHSDSANMAAEGWSRLERVFRGIDVMASGTSLVGNSKVMAHLLPNVVSPIDRAYTLTHLFGNGNVQNDLDSEWLLMRKILEGFFYPIANEAVVREKAAEWISDKARYPWDTSMLKVVDNLLIGAMQQPSG